MSVHDSATVEKRRVLLGPGVGWGALGVVAFSLTLPASRAALPAFGPITVGLGRAVVAAALAGICLLVVRAPRPTRSQTRGLAMVALGAVVGFPICSAIALVDATSAHGAVLIGLMPATTAAIAVLRGGERPSASFWIASAAGLVAVIVFAVVQGGGQIGASDLWLLAAVLLGSLAYAEGGVLAREMPGWQVISWALVLAVPVVVVVAVVGVVVQPPHDPTAMAWLGMAYVSLISMFAGFFAWYRGLATGGVARIAQLQLAQPVLTVGWSVLLLGEQVTAATIVAGLVVVGTVAATLASRRRERK
ncbi:DMT family transporter [Pseudonocardia sp. GCM10023141]|uniref:DMT family transporter n=1 Tax=Pseudonocardia sp. GCM10023141 TaxID=3252653 RepID=UPI00360D3DBA